FLNTILADALLRLLRQLNCPLFSTSINILSIEFPFGNSSFLCSYFSSISSTNGCSSKYKPIVTVKNKMIEAPIKKMDENFNIFLYDSFLVSFKSKANGGAPNKMINGIILNTPAIFCQARLEDKSEASIANDIESKVKAPSKITLDDIHPYLKGVLNIHFRNKAIIGVINIMMKAVIKPISKAVDNGPSSSGAKAKLINNR